MDSQPVVTGDRWGVHSVAGHATLHVVHGPAPVDVPALARWLERSCEGPVPVRQGFVAVLVRPDGSLVAAASNRLEVTAYWAFERGRPVIAAHLQDIVRALDVPPALDIDKLADLMVLHDDGATTTYVGVHRLPVGHRLTWSPRAREPRVERWYRPLEDEPLRVSMDEAPGLMRETVRDAVAASLPASGDVAGTLSGGLDSSMVLGATARLLHPEGRTVHALTSVPLTGAVEPRVGWIVSDGPDAERMCREVPGLTWTGVANDDHVLSLDILERTFEKTWCPVLNPSNTIWITELVRRAEELGVPLLLTGATGNGPFSRDRAGVVRTLLRQRRLGPLLSEPRRRRAATGQPWLRIARDLAGETVLSRPWRRARVSPFAASMPVLADRLDERRQGLLARFDRFRDPQQSWVDLVTRDASTSLVAQDLSHAVWWSDPLCDPEVVRLALRMPPEAWLHGGTSRGLAREAARGVVPDHIRLRQARGAQSADVGLVMASRRQSYLDALDVLRASHAAGQFIDLDALGCAVEHDFPGDGDDARTWLVTHDRAFGFGMFAAWHETTLRRLA